MEYSEVLDRLAAGIAQAEYSLLLGAGASLGAVGRNQRPLPTGVELRSALLADFDIYAEEEISLAAAYEHIRRVKPRDLAKYLRDWFTGCQPTWQSLLVEFNWRRIWTFNIDDVVERAYLREGRTVKSLAWEQRFSERDPSNVPQVIHLHGMACHLKAEENNESVLVFSSTEYARAVANPKTWHKVFYDEFAGRPFLVIGARLVDEIDLSEVLENGSAAIASTGYPSVVVLPSISNIRREQLEAANLTVIQREGEQFIRDLLEHYRAERSRFAEVYGGVTPGLRRFQQQFIDLTRYTPRDSNAGDFYSGYQPTWNTVLNDDDAPLDKTKEASAYSDSLSIREDVYQSIVLLTGGPGTGKSTGLLRIANALIARGIHPFLFRGDEYLDVDATIEWLRAVPRTVLLIDDCSDFSNGMQQLAERCSSEGVRIMLICSDRSSRLQLIQDRIDSRYLDLSTPIGMER